MDGQLERANQRVEQYLRIYGNDEQNDWAELLPLAQYTHNTTRNESTNATPFKLLIGRTPTYQIQEQETPVPEITRQKSWLERGRLQAQAAIKSTRKMVELRATRRKGKRSYKGFEEGEQVWLEGTNLQLSHPMAKLAPRRYGPFKITKKISPVVFRLELLAHWTIHDVFHASLLTPYRETIEHGKNYLEPLPEQIEGEDEFEVERILKSRRHGRGRKLQFLIRWKGYSTAHDSWEDAKDVHAPALLEEFYQRQDGSVRVAEYKKSDEETTLGTHNSGLPLQIATISLSCRNLPRRSAYPSIMQHGASNKEPTNTSVGLGGGDNDPSWTPWIFDDWVRSSPANLTEDADWSTLYSALNNLTAELAIQCAEGLAFAELSRKDSLISTNDSSGSVEPSYTPADEYFNGWPSTPYPSPRTANNVEATDP
jgi:hypothetical protein